MSTDVKEFIEDMDGGVLSEQLSRVLSMVAGAVIDHGRKGTVTLQFDMKQIATSHQVNVTSTMRFEAPTKRGKQTEHQATSTPMYVGRAGKLTFFPEKQGVMFDKGGQPAGENDRFPVDRHTGEVQGRPSSHQ